MATGANVCNCPDPPGGQAVCSAEQLAICRVVNGKVQTECHSLPSGIARVGTEATQNWALSHITQVSRSLTQTLGVDDLSILNSGQYMDPRAGVEVTFGLPAGMSSGYAAEA